MKTDAALWQAINAYDLDVADAALPFSRHLARDNGWTRDFALRAIAEYKRFIYLICVSGSTLTPSEEIDSVWHLHLLYTHDYWNRFCDDLLSRQVHHCPTKGGKTEADKYLTCYGRTLMLYEAEFGVAPPNDLWPEENVRFAPPTMRQVDIRKHLIIARQHVFLWGAGTSALLLAACSTEKVSQAIHGEPLVSVLAVAAVVLGVMFAGRIISAAPKAQKGKRDGSGCGGGGCGSGGSDFSSGDGGSGCGGGCGGGD